MAVDPAAGIRTESAATCGLGGSAGPRGSEFAPRAGAYHGEAWEHALSPLGMCTCCEAKMKSRARLLRGRCRWNPSRPPPGTVGKSLGSGFRREERCRRSRPLGGEVRDGGLLDGRGGDPAARGRTESDAGLTGAPGPPPWSCSRSRVGNRAREPGSRARARTGDRVGAESVAPVLWFCLGLVVGRPWPCGARRGTCRSDVYRARAWAASSSASGRADAGQTPRSSLAVAVASAVAGSPP